MLPEKFKAILQKHSFHENIHWLSSHRLALTELFSTCWPKWSTALPRMIRSFLQHQTIFLSFSPLLYAAGSFTHCISNNLRNKAVLNKLVIEKKFTLFKIYKYRNMFYRVKLTTTFFCFIFEKKVLYLVFTLINLVTQLLRMHITDVHHKMTT